MLVVYKWLRALRQSKNKRISVIGKSVVTIAVPGTDVLDVMDFVRIPSGHESGKVFD